jgi:hypothetical protein
MYTLMYVCIHMILHIHKCARNIIHQQDEAREAIEKAQTDWILKVQKIETAKKAVEMQAEKLIPDIRNNVKECRKLEQYIAENKHRQVLIRVCMFGNVCCVLAHYIHENNMIKV